MWVKHGRVRTHRVHTTDYRIFRANTEKGFSVQCDREKSRLNAVLSQVATKHDLPVTDDSYLSEESDETRDQLRIRVIVQ